MTSKAQKKMQTLLRLTTLPYHVVLQRSGVVVYALCSQFSCHVAYYLDLVMALYASKNPRSLLFVCAKMTYIGSTWELKVTRKWSCRHVLAVGKKIGPKLNVLLDPFIFHVLRASS